MAAGYAFQGTKRTFSVTIKQEVTQITKNNSDSGPVQFIGTGEEEITVGTVWFFLTNRRHQQILMCIARYYE